MTHPTAGKPTTPNVGVGSQSKPCVECGKLIHRTNEDNIKWLRRAYCNKACQTEGMKRNEWNKRHK